MAIKIIKQGVKEFHITCPYCGCEFTYENEDVHENIVNCPCCGAMLDAKQYMNGTVIVSPSPMPIWYNQQAAPDGYKIRGGLNQPDDSCENCPNNPKYLKTPYVGDSPCQWCQKCPWKITYTSNLKQ